MLLPLITVLAARLQDDTVDPASPALRSSVQVRIINLLISNSFTDSVRLYLSVHVVTVPSERLLIQGQITLIWYSRKEYSSIHGENREPHQKFASNALIFDTDQNCQRGLYD
jgi:hypothetical protein